MLLLVSLLAAIVFLGIFLFSLHNGQYDDDHTPAIRILFDDEIKKEQLNVYSKKVVKAVK
jgi:cbb3-type cytochrome oxidase maturation protein